MTVRRRASVIPGMLALTALSLTACASQGTIGAGASGGSLPKPAQSSPANSSAATGTGTSAPSSSGTDSSAPSSADSSPATPTSEDPSALASSLKTLNDLWKDQGCKTGLAGFSDYLYAQQQGPAQGIAAIPNAVPKIRAGAQQTKKPEAAQAMNKLAADLLAMYTQAQQGQTPNKGPVRSDFQLMGQVCSEQQP